MNVFLVPVYNEAANIPALAVSLLNAGTDQDAFVFVDDGSSDGTPEMIRKSFAGREVHVVVNTANRGPGFSFNAGFGWIAAHVKGDDIKIVTLEGDNTSDLSILPVMLSKAAEGFGLVLASVYAPGGGFSRPSHYRMAVSNIANGLLRAAFRLETRTLTSFYRVYDMELLRQINKKYGSFCDERGFICKVELLLRARVCGAHISEVPVTLQSHLRKGDSKMKILKTGMEYLSFLIRSLRRYR